MKKLVLSIIFLLIIPTALALIPENIQSICEGLNLEHCIENSQWQDHDNCLSQIRCNPLFDDNLEFKECQTILRNIMDDCENNPTTSCYNGIAYDTSYSETCDEGVRFKKIDACGNKLDWGSCIDLDSCEIIIKTPFTGSEIPVHENCAFTDGIPVKEVERPAREQIKIGDKVVEFNTIEEDENSPEQNTEDSVPILYKNIHKIEPIDEYMQEVQSQQGQEEQAAQSTPTEPKTTITKVKPDEPDKAIVALVGTIFLLLIALIIAVVLWRKR